MLRTKLKSEGCRLRTIWVMQRTYTNSRHYLTRMQNS